MQMVSILQKNQNLPLVQGGVIVLVTVHRNVGQGEAVRWATMHAWMNSKTGSPSGGSIGCGDGPQDTDSPIRAILVDCHTRPCLHRNGVQPAGHEEDVICR